MTPYDAYARCLPEESSAPRPARNGANRALPYYEGESSFRKAACGHGLYRPVRCAVKRNIGRLRRGAVLSNLQPYHQVSELRPRPKSPYGPVRHAARRGYRYRTVRGDAGIPVCYDAVQLCAVLNPTRPYRRSAPPIIARTRYRLVRSPEAKSLRYRTVSNNTRA